MTVIGIVLFLIVAGIALSIAGFLLNLALAFLLGGWALASAIVCRLRYGSWSKPPTPESLPRGIERFN
jgi:hypothetical protein